MSSRWCCRAVDEGSCDGFTVRLKTGCEIVKADLDGCYDGLWIFYGSGDFGLQRRKFKEFEVVVVIGDGDGGWGWFWVCVLVLVMVVGGRHVGAGDGGWRWVWLWVC